MLENPPPSNKRGLEVTEVAEIHLATGDETPEKTEMPLEPFKRRRLIGPEMVSVIVGAEHRVFTVHKDLLYASSDYFTKALREPSKGASDRSLEALEHKSQTFETILLWLYTGSIFESDETINDVSFNDLVDMYIFAEKYFFPKLQNGLIDLIIQKCDPRKKKYITPSDGNLYGRTISGSMLRKLVVHIVANFNLPCMSMKSYPPEYLRDIYSALWETREQDPAVPRYDKRTKDLLLCKKWLWEERCQFHTHAAGEPKCSGSLDSI